MPIQSEIGPSLNSYAPIAGLTPRTIEKGVHWVESELVAEVSFREWTDDGLVRHSVFRGLREDKPAGDIVEERPPQTARILKGRKRVKLSSPDKVLFPDQGITKRQLADYWESVAPIALPLIANRPLSLLRCPDGTTGQCFYQKHAGAGVPDAVPRVTVEENGDPYAMVDDVQSLTGLVQIGALELHVWGSRAENIEQPDIIVFDLDPSENLSWTVVVDAATNLKRRLESLGLVPFARVTGGKGLHVVVPVVPGPDWRAVKHFSRTLASEMVRSEPRRFTTSMSKARRAGKVFIDYLRNDRGSTAIASYSPRARPGAPVAMPVEWSDLNGNDDAPPKYGILDVPGLLRDRPRDPWQDFESSRRSLIE